MSLLRTGLCTARATRRVVLFFAAIALSLCAACSTTGSRDGEWAEADIDIPSERVLRQIAVLAMERNGFPPGTPDGNEAATIVSGWKIDLQPFKGRGMRQKAHLAYEERGAGKFHIFVRVEKDTNEELAKPLDLEQAQWESAPDDQEMASRIVRYMQTMLGNEFQLAPPIEAPVEDLRKG